jgi:uncharacterized protein DUF222
VVITTADRQSGTAALWGSLFATDAALLDRRLDQLADQVCGDDPRTIAQRRADALGALAAGAERLACACGTPECPAALDTDPRATAVLVHVIADRASLEAEPDPHTSGALAPRPLTPDTPLREALSPDPHPPAPVKLPAAHLIGGGVVPAPQLAELIRDGAKVRPLGHLAGAAAELGYRPSAWLERFVRCRDMTCRFPGCDRPAESCDLDHTIPYPHGPTHPSNLKCLCRKHHLLKTFWRGWHDEQRPDGTVIWTTSTGNTYVTRPGSRLLFPALCLPTDELPTALRDDRLPSARGVLMPKRRRTREQDRAYRIDAERARNQEPREKPENDCAEAYFPSRPRLPANDEPPPF